MINTSARYLNIGLSMLGTFSAPIQYLLEYPHDPKALCITHKSCNLEALKLIKESGNTEIATILENNLPQLQEGVKWADLEFKNINHFFDPITRKGLWRFSSGVYDFSVYLAKACRYAKKQNIEISFFYLGAAAHLLQDMSVPHHVCGHLFNGHKKFENWVQCHLEEFTCPKNPIRTIKKPLDLLLHNATIAREFMPLVGESATEENYRYAAKNLLPIAKASSAELFKWFIKTKILLKR